MVGTLKHVEYAHTPVQMDAAAQSLTQLPPDRPAAVATIAAGAPLPVFSARAVDAWGNAAAPTDAMPCELVLECPALEPPSIAAPFSAAGLACMQGMDPHRTLFRGSAALYMRPPSIAAPISRAVVAPMPYIPMIPQRSAKTES